MATNTSTQRTAAGNIWLVIVAALTLVGTGVWVYQLTNGLGATGLNNLDTWGLYIAGFIFFLGLSAGSLILASLPVIFDLDAFKPYAKIAALVALASLIVGGLFIMIDIGKPIRLWHIVTYAQLGSPMLWDLLLTVVYLIITTVYLNRLIRSEQSGEDAPKVIAFIALIAGLADGLMAFVFATQMAHEFWFSAVQPMAFVVAGLASAGAMLMLILPILKRVGYVAMDCCELRPLALVTASLLSLSLLLVASEVITLGFARAEAANELVNVMLGSPLFWVEVMAIAISAGLFFLPATSKDVAPLSIASLLALVGLAAKRFVFVHLGLAIPNIDYPGVEVVPTGYAPNLVEWGVALGLVSLFALLVTIGFRALPLQVKE